MESECVCVVHVCVYICECLCACVYVCVIVYEGVQRERGAVLLNYEWYSAVVEFGCS